MSFSTFLVNEAGGVDIMGIVDTVDNVKSVDSVDNVNSVDSVNSVHSVNNVNSVNSVNRFNRCNRCKKNTTNGKCDETDKNLTKSDENRAIRIAPSRGTFLKRSRTLKNTANVKLLVFWVRGVGPYAKAHCDFF